ncbi:hypothetical protein DFH07DRAFT_351332 [Mycena maculata]|uniref:F-box domain-containing protein n=1 Tax=Mycena maculata TaxID=230809 RepID=A0AAD7NM59_9AGAR|nr:hypothetical protein DFH07DRAFT_351332 [Mycena maculata]
MSKSADGTGLALLLLSKERLALAAGRSRIAEIDHQIRERALALRSLRDGRNLPQGGPQEDGSAFASSPTPRSGKIDALVSDGAQISQEVSALRALRAERDLLQGRLDAYTYPVLTLPNEIVSEIFVRFLPSYPKSPPIIGPLSPNILGQICRKWREIALSTPALWRGITMDLNPFSDFRRALGLLDTSLARSGSCALSIRLECTGVAPKEVAPFVDAISSACARWGHLALCTPRRSFRAIVGLLPLLRSLSIMSLTQFSRALEDTPTATRAFHTAPLLHKVTLQYHRTSPLSDLLPWARLTVLIVNYIAPERCADLLNATSSLVYCRLRVYYDIHHGPQSLKSVTPLAHLKTLILCAIGPHILPNFLNIFTLPALRRFRATEALIQPDPAAALIALVVRSGCALDELCVTGSSLPRRIYRNALPSVGSFRFKRGLDKKGAFFGVAESEDDTDGGDELDIGEDEDPDQE